MTDNLPPAVSRVGESVLLDWRGLMGRGYDWLATWHGRYLFVTGGRGSKKSTNIAQKLVLDFFSADYVNILVLRRYKNTHKDSTHAAICKAIARMGLLGEVHIHNTTLQITRVSTGQVIKFAGLDDEPEKIKSLEAAHGWYCRCWIEEVSEIESYTDFQTAQLSVRGRLPDGAYHQVICSFNPSRPFWAKTMFFDRVDPTRAEYDADFARECLCVHTTAYCNEWITPDYLDMLDGLDAELRRVNLFGEWGVESGGAVLTNWDVWQPDTDDYLLDDLAITHKDLAVVCGLDFGYKHPTAFVCCAVSLRAREVWVFSERSWDRAYLAQIAADLRKDGYTRHKIVADAAEPKSIAEMRDLHGLVRVVPARKGRDSKHYGVQYLAGFRLHVHRSCGALVRELLGYHYDVDGELPDIDDDHIDALRYAVTSVR